MKMTPMFKKVLATIVLTSLSVGTSIADDSHDFEKFGISPVAPWPTLSEKVKNTYSQLISSQGVKKAISFILADDDRTMQDTITLTEIPAPEFKEEKRAKAFAELLRNAGLSDVRIDQEGNVIGIRKGVGKGPTVVLDAHLDTVFPIETNVKVKKVGTKYYAPGITDDTRGLAVMISIIRALNDAKIQTIGDIIFLGSVGEEGNGDLRGIKAFFKEYRSVDAYVGMEAIPFGSVVIQNAGSKRFEVTYKGPGGHSYGAFGTVPSAIHAMGRAIDKISDLKVPSQPKTTYNVGIIKGGRSVNTIADEASMEVDIRSSGAKELNQTVDKILAIIKSSAIAENKRWKTDSLTVSIKQIGDRPGGMTPANAMIIEAALGGIRALNKKESIMFSASTNSGTPISLGIPAIQIGPGGKFWGFHALSEGMDAQGAYQGVQAAMVTVLGMVGVQGISQPLIEIRANR